MPLFHTNALTAVLCNPPNLNIILIESKCEKAGDANKNANILQQEDGQSFPKTPCAGSFHSFVEFRHHVDQRDVEEHAAGEAEDVAGGALQLPEQDAEDQPKVTSARRQEVVHQRLRDFGNQTLNDQQQLV